MWRIWTIVLTLLLVAGVASASERPACTFDTNGNIIIPEKGVCFLDLKDAPFPFGFIAWTGSSQNDVLIVSWEFQKDFERHKSNGDAKVYFISANDVQLTYCPPSVVEANHCGPLYDTELYHGTGNFHFQFPLDLPCPLTAHVEGDVTSPKGESFKIQAIAVYVPDKTSDWGCRMVKVDEITLRAK